VLNVCSSNSGKFQKGVKSSGLLAVRGNVEESSHVQSLGFLVSPGLLVVSSGVSGSLLAGRALVKELSNHVGFG